MNININESNSQAGQDIFAKYVCDTNSGYFLDLGCREPIIYNNTYLLETIGWNGLLIDMNEKAIIECKEIRKSKSYAIDLTKIEIDGYIISIEKLLIDNNCPNIIDYMSFDIDDSTLDVLNIFPFDKFTFKCITFEHDSYRNGNNLQRISRKKFDDLGYKLICGNVKYGGNTFEDWYINETLVEQYLYEHLICDNSEWLDIIKKI
jgi:hypothetical protein